MSTKTRTKYSVVGATVQARDQADDSGTFLYHCEDHPWAVVEITVDP